MFFIALSVSKLTDSKSGSQTNFPLECQTVCKCLVMICAHVFRRYIYMHGALVASPSLPTPLLFNSFFFLTSNTQTGTKIVYFFLHNGSVSSFLTLTPCVTAILTIPMFSSLNLHSFFPIEFYKSIVSSQRI